jgi:hypothetical protein
VGALPRKPANGPEAPRKRAATDFGATNPHSGNASRVTARPRVGILSFSHQQTFTTARSVCPQLTETTNYSGLNQAKPRKPKATWRGRVGRLQAPLLRRGLSPRTMAIEDGAVARLLPADCLSIQEVGATGMLPPRAPSGAAPQNVPGVCWITP